LYLADSASLYYRTKKYFSFLSAFLPHPTAFLKFEDPTFPLLKERGSGVCLYQNVDGVRLIQFFFK